jgi:hypothetical protein
MALNNLTTPTTTEIAVSVKLTAMPANDRLGLGFEVGAYSADAMSPMPTCKGAGSRQEQPAEPMRKQTHAGDPDAVPPAGTVGDTPGSRAVVMRPFPASANWPAAAADNAQNRWPSVSASRTRNRRDCQSPARDCGKQSLPREVVLATTAGK